MSVHMSPDARAPLRAVARQAEHLLLTALMAVLVAVVERRLRRAFGRRAA